MKIINKKNQSFSPGRESIYKVLVYAIIGTGIFLRLYHFFYNRSLWEDEIYLSNGLIKHNIADIFTKPLPYLQKAPPGYLLLSHFFVSVFGNNEMALRLYSLLCGIMSLFVFLPIGRYFLKKAGLIIALCIFSYAPPLVYHSVEAKPYITELLASLIIVWWFIKYQHEQHLKKLLIWGISGAIIVWFAYPAIFVLAAAGITVLIPYLKTKNWNAILKLSVPALMWVVSFAISYLLYAKDGSASGWLVYFWIKQDAYIPLKPVGAIVWITHHLFSFFHYPLGLSWYNNWNEHNTLRRIVERMAFIPLFLVFMGIVYFYKNRKSCLLLVITIFFIAIAASAFKLYPVSERLMTYLAPFGIILIAAGCELFFRLNLFAKFAGYLIAILLITGPFINSVAQIIDPGLFGDYKKSYQREALFYLNSHYQPGDLVYVYWNDLPGYTLYKEMYNLKFNGIPGKDYRKNAVNFEDYFSKLNKDFAILKGKKRVWLIYSNHFDIRVGDFVDHPAWYYKKHDGISRFHNFLLSNAIEKDSYRAKGKNAVSDINVSLMDFSLKH